VGRLWNKLTGDTPRKRPQEAGLAGRRERLGLWAAKLGIATPMEDGRAELGPDASVQVIGDVDILFPREDLGDNFEAEAVPIIERRRQAYNEEMTPENTNPGH